jgi:hypothetical protein
MKTTSDASRRRAALALAALVFGVCVPVLYVLQRLYEASRGQWVDPASILRQVHVAYYYRALAAVWFAAFIGALVYQSSARRDVDLDARARFVARLGLLLVPLSALAAWLVP